MSREWIVLSACRQRGGLSEVDHVPNTASRVVHVALEPRDDVHVEVHDGLSRRLTRVEPDVVAVGVKLLEPVRGHPTGDDKRVPA